MDCHQRTQSYRLIRIFEQMPRQISTPTTSEIRLSTYSRDSSCILSWMPNPCHSASGFRHVWFWCL